MTHCQPWELLPVGAWTATSRHSSKISRETGRSKSRRFRTARVVVRMWCASISSIVGLGSPPCGELPAAERRGEGGSESPSRSIRWNQPVARLRRKIGKRLVDVVFRGSDHRKLVVGARCDFDGRPPPRPPPPHPPPLPHS